MATNRHVIIGDVHGCIDELKLLLDKVKFCTTGDNLIFVGDLIDRGPDSLAVLQLARNLGAKTVMGNHCLNHIRWRDWEEKVASGEARHNPMRRFNEQTINEHNKLSREDMEYMRRMPSFLKLDGIPWIIVHGGFESGPVPYQDQPIQAVCRIRNVGHDGLMAVDKENPLKDVPGSVPWAMKWSGPENVVYGHAVHSLSSPRIDDHGSYKCYGIDTGCVFGGRLTALVIENANVSIHQVNSINRYKNLRVD